MKAKLEKTLEYFTDKVKEEVVFEGNVFTVARVTILPNGDDGPKVIGEGVAKRSGPYKGLPDEPDPLLGKSIALGRARKAVALKLKKHKEWIKISHNLMG